MKMFFTFIALLVFAPLIVGAINFYTVLNVLEDTLPESQEQLPDVNPILD
jgi:hypothetical protein